MYFFSASIETPRGFLLTTKMMRLDVLTQKIAKRKRSALPEKEAKIQSVFDSTPPNNLVERRDVPEKVKSPVDGEISQFGDAQVNVEDSDWIKYRYILIASALAGFLLLYRARSPY
jgi:hypothetical protein